MRWTQSATQNRIFECALRSDHQLVIMVKSPQSIVAIRKTNHVAITQTYEGESIIVQHPATNSSIKDDNGDQTWRMLRQDAAS